MYQLYRQHEEFGENYLDITSPPTLAPFSPNGPGFYPEMAHALASSTEEEDEMGSRSSQNNEETLSNSGKRQYRRHPKADLNAPIKPASGYVMFANVLREEIKEQNLSFADIAKVVGERWKQIGADEKFYWEDAAAKAKHEYLKQVAEYKKTANYEVSHGAFRVCEHSFSIYTISCTVMVCIHSKLSSLPRVQMYQKYLRQFEQQGSDRVLGRPRRRRGMRGQRRDSPSMAATGASSGNESISMQREPSLTAVDSPRPTREPLVRSNSGDSVSQVYKPLSVVYRQSSIRNQDKRPENARSASHQSSGSTESSNSSESAAVPSLEQEALRFSKHEHSH